MTRSIDTPETSPRDCYPPQVVLLAAHHLADRLPSAVARQAVRELFDDCCSDVLGKGDRQELLEGFFAGRERSRRECLENVGLVPDYAISGCYQPGCWRLRAEPADCGWRFVIDGIHADGGEILSVCLTVQQFNSSASALRLIKQAVRNVDFLRLTAAEWRRIWDGFAYRDGCGHRRWARGLRLRLHDQLIGGE